MKGEYGDERFDFVKIIVGGCELGDKCASEEEIMQQSYDFWTLRSLPNLLTNNRDDILYYYRDNSYYRFLDPDLR